MPDLDFNTLVTPGNYKITGYPTNGPSLPLNISGASIGSLIVTGILEQNGRIFQIMISAGAITWRTTLDMTGATWSNWQQLLSGNKVGDGIRVTNGVISIPEMEGATSTQNGTSGLVPPPLKTDVGKTLSAEGNWIYPADIAISNNQSDLATQRGQIGIAKELGNNVDYNTVTKAGFYLINATGGVNGPIAGSAIFLHVFCSKEALTKNLYQIAYAYSPARERMFLRQYRLASNDWSSWSEIVSSSRIGDGITVNNGIISVPEYEGATTSSAGTAGLVPPATTKQTDFVLCGDGEWKDISKIAAHAAGPSNKTITITLTGTSTTYTAPETGWISYRAVSTTANSWISLTIETTTLYAVDRPVSDNSNIALNLPISKGQKATINCVSNVTFTSREAHFIYTNGSVPA